MQQIGLAMHDYLEAFHHFPPPAILDAEGKPGLSWRVAILPFLGAEGIDLYREFHLDERWDSPHNKPLLAKIPAAYRVGAGQPARPEGSDTSMETPFRVFVGPGALFDKPEGTMMKDILDHTSRTLLVVEAATSVPWTAPDTLAFDKDIPLPRLGGSLPGGAMVLLADGRVRILKENASPEILRTWITRDGREIENGEIFLGEPPVPAPSPNGEPLLLPTAPAPELLRP